MSATLVYPESTVIAAAAGRRLKTKPARVVTHTDLDDRTLLEHAAARSEGTLTAHDTLSVSTGKFTGRSPEDKYVVDEPTSRDAIWWGDVNQRMPEHRFDQLVSSVEAFLNRRATYTQHLAVGADNDYRYPVDLTTERAWVALFARHLFIVPGDDGDRGTGAPIRILHAPGYRVCADILGTRSSTVIALHPGRRTIVITGTEYAGEVKKSVFTLMNYLLPERDIATMHCSANVGDDGSATIFFGLSGTGKTTLSNDPDRQLIGDDEHGWSDDGVFNLEGGCYAKTINLSSEDEPGIYAATNHSGTVLENVVVDPESNLPDFDDDTLTENTRSAFSLDVLPNAAERSVTGHPDHIVLLTADATGVLPPVARLTREQAISLFLLGFTSKVAGTERGLTEPEATFSPCFAEPFLPLPPERYADLLAEKIDRHEPTLWLVNTGWSGGSFATGERISIAHTRSLVGAITSGALTDAETSPEPVFGFRVPVSIPGVPDEALQPRDAWDDPADYDDRAARLRKTFQNQAEKQGIDERWVGWLK
ncbi:MAG: phosphoenolpyruvate carboxykinase (ATP) [Thermomicrobiales bacterium]